MHQSRASECASCLKNDELAHKTPVTPGIVRASELGDDFAQPVRHCTDG